MAVMKKGILLTCTLIYLTLAVGIAKSTHLCMGREMAISYFSTNAEYCSTDETPAMPCCDDELEVISVEDEHLSKSFDFNLIDAFTLIEPAMLLDIQALCTARQQTLFTDLPDPPEVNKEPLYIITSSFTYYG